MSRQVPTPSATAFLRGGTWLARALIAVVAVVGVVATHGLTANHDAAMTSMNAGDTTGLFLAATGTGDDAVMPHEAAIGSPVTGMAYEDAATVPVQGLRTGTPHGPAGTVVACLAFLVGLLLLLGAGRLLARLRRAACGALLRRRGFAWRATAVPRLRPDLVELSVLRT